MHHPFSPNHLVGVAIAIMMTIFIVIQAYHLNQELKAQRRYQAETGEDPALTQRRMNIVFSLYAILMVSVLFAYAFASVQLADGNPLAKLINTYFAHFSLVGPP